MERPRARNTDPDSSHEAAEAIVQIAETQCDHIHEGLKIRPEHTSLELAVAMDEDRYVVARRLSDLEHQKRAEKTGSRKCEIGGRKAVTWRAL